MCRFLLVTLLAFCLSRASPLQGPPPAASVNGARETEHEESSVAPSNTDKPTAELGPEVSDMLSGVTVNQTFLHKADNDNDEPGVVIAPVPELSTHRSVPDHETNLTDRVDSPRVLDPGTTHQEDSHNKSSPVLKAENATREDSTNVQTTLKPLTEDSIAIPEEKPKITNTTVKTSSSAPSNKSEATTLPAVRKTEEQVTGKPVVNNTQAPLNNATQPPPPPTSTVAEVVQNPTATPALGAPAKNKTKPELPPRPVEVFAPSALNESQNLLAGYQPQTSEQHADHLQLSGTADPSFLQPSQSAAILAGVFVMVALLGYVGLLVWRRLLEKKYGNREMLVNEDEFYDTSDLRHFEL